MTTYTEKRETKNIQLILEGYPDVLKVEHVCGILNISRKLAYRLLKEGQIEHLTIGRSYRIPKINLIRYLLKSKIEEEV